MSLGCNYLDWLLLMLLLFKEDELLEEVSVFPPQ